jgi:hypothetical protein
VSRGQRAGLWIVLCLVGGAACAFLTLEVLGIPYVLVFLAGMIFLSRRFGLLAESLAAFGLGFTVLAARFVIPNIDYFSGRGDFLSSLLFGLFLLIGIGFIVAAAWIRRPSRWFQQ